MKLEKHYILTLYLAQSLVLRLIIQGRPPNEEDIEMIILFFTKEVDDFYFEGHSKQ